MSDNYSPREAGIEVNSFMHRYYKELAKTDEYKDAATYDVHLESIDPKTKLYPVYVQLFATKLPIDKLIRIASNADYSHATIALDPSMNNMYSFASLPYTKGILGGDVSIGRESIWSPWYQCCRFFTVLVTFVDKKGRDAIQNKIDYFIEHHEEFDYNTIGCVEYFFGQKNFNNDERAKTKWFCSEFVAACLDTGGVEGHKNIYMSPGDLAKTPNMIEIGTYTLDSFDEKDVIKKTKIAEKQFRRDMTLNEAFTDYPDSKELSEAAFDFFKKIPRTSAQKEAIHKSRITAFIDWKKLADEFSKLFPKTKPELRFNLIELIVNKKVRAADVAEKDATNVIIKEMQNIRNKIRHGFIRLIDSVRSLITFRDDTEDINVQYPDLNVVQDQSSDQGLVFESTLNEYIHTTQIEDPDERKAMMKKYGLRPAGYGQDTRKEDEERMKKSHEWEKKIPLRQRKKIYREDGEGLVPGHEEVGDPDDVLPLEESYVLNKKLLTINEDKWGKGAHNILFITGLSGSGKSTLSVEFEQAGKAEMFDIDGIEQGYDTTEKTKILTEYSKQNKDFAEFYDLVSNPNKYSDKSVDKFRKEVFTKYHTKYEGWLRDIIKLLHKHRDTLYTVNGVQLFEVMNPEDFKGEPVAIVGTSVVNSMLRRMRRNSIDAGHGGKIQWKKEFENEFFQMLAWYFDDEKQLRKFKKGLKETAVSDDTKGTDQDFHNVGKAAGWYKGWTADGCQFDLEGVAQDNDAPDSGADGAYRVEAPVDSQDEPWLGTVHNLNNPDKSVNESMIKRDDYIEFNFEKWSDNSDHNAIYITGLSGSGKTTLGNKLAKEYNATYVNLDHFMSVCRKGKEHLSKKISENTWTDISIYKKYFTENPDGYIPRGDRVKTPADISRDEVGIYYLRFSKWFKKLLKTPEYRGNRYVVEGVHIYEFESYELYRDEPVVVMNAGLLKALFRRERRGLGVAKEKFPGIGPIGLVIGTIKDSVTFAIPMYINQEPVINKFRSGMIAANKDMNESVLDKFRKTIPAKDAEKITNTVVNKLKVLIKPYRDARLQPSYYGMTDRNKCIMIEMLDLDLGQYEREGYSDTLKDLCKKLENDRDIKRITEIKGFSNGDGDEGCIYVNLKYPVDDAIHETTSDLPDKVLADPTNPTMVDKYRKLGYEFDPSRGTIRGRAQYMYYGVKINEPAEEPKFTIDIDQSGKGVCTDIVIKKLKTFIESRLNQVSTDNPEDNANVAKELLYAVDLIETYLINNVDKRSVYYCELINLRTLAIDFVAKVTETDASVVQDYERVKPGCHTRHYNNFL